MAFLRKHSTMTSIGLSLPRKFSGLATPIDGCASKSNDSRVVKGVDQVLPADSESTNKPRRRVAWQIDGDIEEESSISTLQAIVDDYQILRTCSLDRDTQFSWIRSAVFFGSYLLLLTDMFRTTIAIRHINYTPLEPSVFSSFGPYGYPVNHVLWNATADEAARVWSYKFDTTSAGVRSVAQFLNLSSWPACLLYKSHCDGLMIECSAVFGMLDSLVETVSQRTVQRKSDRPKLTLRIELHDYDRVHDYVLPFIFERKKVRTVQALYYDMETVANEQFQFCDRSNSQPYTCGDNWINFQVTCAAQNAPCVQSRLMWKDIIINTRNLAQTYPDLQMDMLLVEGYEDSGLASLSLQSRQMYDVTIVTRIRNCTQGSASNASQCRTIAVDDYRYEGESLTTDVVGWFDVIAAIRVFGQSYAYLRMILLFVCCYKARSTEPEFIRASHEARMQMTLRTMFTVPSQVVIYGNAITVFAYTIAHLFDSSIVYGEVFDKFTSLVGNFHVDIPFFIRIATISMRSLWLLASVFHVLLYIRTRDSSIPMTKGIPGISEFTISATSFLTICAQYRALVFRNTNVVSIAEIISSDRRRKLRSAGYNNTRQLAYLFCIGDTLDAKFLPVAFLVVTICSVVIYGIVCALSKLRILVKHELTLWPRSNVSYAAGMLWPVNALVVSWYGSIATPVGVKRYLSVQPSRSLTRTVSYKAVVSSYSKRSSALVIVNNSKESRAVRDSIACLNGRSPSVKATLFLMNLTVMSDPVVLLRLYWLGGHEIGIYKSTEACDQLYFLPLALESSEEFCMIDFRQLELLGAVNSMDLPWTVLLQCG